jgi:ankyrin repeat protein
VDYLLSQGASLDTVEDNRRPIHWAARSGHLGTVKLILGVNPAEATARSRFSTVLGDAAAAGRKDVALYLLEHTAVDPKESWGPLNLTALHLLAGHPEGLHRLLSSLKEDLLQRALYRVTGDKVEKDRAEIAKALIDRGCDPNALPDTPSSDFRDTALQTACSKGWFDLARVLVDGGADVNLNASKYVGPALRRCRARDGAKAEEMAAYLVERGATK